MRITEVKVVPRQDEKLRAFVTITLDNCFVVRGLKIIHSSHGLFVAMPARRKPDGTFQDVAHPIHAEMRAELERIVVAAYLKQLHEGGEQGGDRGDPDGDIT
jgi:stage V sporulation protein G